VTQHSRNGNTFDWQQPAREARRAWTGCCPLRVTSSIARRWSG